MAAQFEFRQARDVATAFTRRSVRYLFLGKSGAIVLGFPDTTQDADVFLKKSPENGEAALLALKDLGFTLNPDEEAQVRRGKDKEVLPRLKGFRDWLKGRSR